jgi:cyclase
MPLTRAVADAVPVPVIASGGAGGASHVAEALTVAQAALLASILHEQPARLRSLRAELRELGVPLRDAAGGTACGGAACPEAADRAADA